MTKKLCDSKKRNFAAPPLPTEERALRIKEAAQILGIGKSTFWALRRQGVLPEGRAITKRIRIWSFAELAAIRDKGILPTS
jgi:predicted DNA-binding transcriptional regulator AlpA